MYACRSGLWPSTSPARQRVINNRGVQDSANQTDGSFFHYQNHKPLYDDDDVLYMWIDSFRQIMVADLFLWADPW